MPRLGTPVQLPNLFLYFSHRESDKSYVFPREDVYMMKMNIRP